MLDDWTSAMMVLASETDILENLSNDEIIDKFAEISRIFSSWPQLRPIDKGDKEVIKFCRL